ncbi:MAG: hypothetical protein GY807_17005 [Gammaproteobacteria bacterium]|nr:hypothetical protein [Gammaproteobacteria bacterium]
MFAPLLGAFLGLFEAKGFGFDREGLGMMDEAVDQRDDASGVGEDLVPLGEKVSLFFVFGGRVIIKYCENSAPFKAGQK